MRPRRLTLDESILTGESEPVPAAGEEVRSGSFAVEGAGKYGSRRSGTRAMRERIAGEARAFRHPRSPLERALNRLLLTLVAVMVPLGVLLGAALWERRTPLDEAVPTTVAAVVRLVPEGLILLASLTYAVAALRMARRGRARAAAERHGVARVGRPRLPRQDGNADGREPARLELVPARASTEDELRPASPRARRSADETDSRPSRNGFPARPGGPSALVPFSSRRRFGAVRGERDSDSSLGAPELFELGDARASGPTRGRRRAARRRLRDHPVALGVIALERAPPASRRSGSSVIAERLRPEARATVEYFRRQGVELKMLSGDRPETVAAIARDVGIPAGRAGRRRELPEDRRARRRS